MANETARSVLDITLSKLDEFAMPTSREDEGRKEMFYLTMHSTHFIYSYMASDIWLRTILIVREETRCRHIGYSVRLAARVYMHHPTERIVHTTAFVTPVVDHWLEREIAPWVHPMKDRSHDPTHHELPSGQVCAVRSDQIHINSIQSELQALKEIMAEQNDTISSLQIKAVKLKELNNTLQTKLEASRNCELASKAKLCETRRLCVELKHSNLHRRLVRIKTFQFAHVRLKTFQFAHVRLKTFQFAHVQLKTFQFAQVRIKTFQFAHVRLKTFQFAHLRLKTF